MEPARHLLAAILYGSGLRLLEVLVIRIKDVDLERHQIMVRRGKGDHDRAALLPTRVRPAFTAQLERVAARQGLGSAWLLHGPPHPRRRATRGGPGVARAVLAMQAGARATGSVGHRRCTALVWRAQFLGLALPPRVGGLRAVAAI
jgi:integrase